LERAERKRENVLFSEKMSSKLQFCEEGNRNPGGKNCKLYFSNEKRVAVAHRTLSLAHRGEWAAKEEGWSIE